MNKLLQKIVALALLIAMTTSSLASANARVTAPLVPTACAAALATTAVLPKKVALNPGELAKYQVLAAQSQVLANGEAAGASDSTKTVLIVVGVVVVVVGVAALVAANQPVMSGPIFPPGTTF